MTTHAYALETTAGGNTAITCSECGPQGSYPNGEAVAAFVQVHDREHAVERNAHRPTQAEIDAWLASPGPGLWEPSAEERAGHVAIPLGYVAIADAIADAATHECAEVRRSQGAEAGDPVTLRVLDSNGRASDHVLDAETAVDVGCIIQALGHDPRAVTVWYVRPLDELKAEAEEAGTP